MIIKYRGEKNKEIKFFQSLGVADNAGMGPSEAKYGMYSTCKIQCSNILR